MPLRLSANVAGMRTSAPGRELCCLGGGVVVLSPVHSPVVSEGFVKKILIKILIYSLNYRQIWLLDPRRCVTVSCTDGSDECVKCSASVDFGTAGAPRSATLRIDGPPSCAALKFSDGARSDVEERASFWFCVSPAAVTLFRYKP